jgi:hypothetical protein
MDRGGYKCPVPMLRSKSVHQTLDILLTLLKYKAPYAGIGAALALFRTTLYFLGPN